MLTEQDTHGSDGTRHTWNKGQLDRDKNPNRKIPYGVSVKRVNLLDKTRFVFIKQLDTRLVTMHFDIFYIITKSCCLD